MKMSLSKVVILVSLILTTTACAQQEGLSFNFFGGGARSEGMGQAFIAVSNDGTAGGWNPAGLYIHEQTLMTFSYGFLLPRGKYDYYNEGSLLTSLDHSGDYGSINCWNLVSPIRIKNHHFVFGLSYTRNFDTYNKFAENLLYERLGYGPEPNATYDRHGGINTISLSLGTRVYEQFSMGLSGNIYVGKAVTEESRYLRAVDSTDANDPVYYRSNINVVDSTAYSGFNLTFGLLYSSESFRAGLTFKSPFNLKGESDSTMTWISTYGTEGKSSPYNGENPDYGMFVTQTVFVDNMTSKTEIPMIIGTGFAFNIKENWLLSTDIEYRGFSGNMIKHLDSLLLTAGGETIEFFSDFDPNWSNVWQFRIGTEYLFDTPVGIIPLRLGYRNESLPEGNISNVDVIFRGDKETSEASDDPGDSTRTFYSFTYDQNKISGFSMAFGTGFHWEQVQLDIAYTYSKYDQEIYEVIDDESVFKGKNNWKNHHLNLTFTGYF